MPEKRRCFGCGEAYWFPGQRWHHEACAGDSTVDGGVSAVVNASNVVVNKNPDRHKDKEARKAYLREYMRKRRAAKSI